MKRLSSCLLLLLPLHAQSGLKPAPAAPAETPVAVAAPTTAEIYRSVVRIEVATQTPDYATPWNVGRFSGGIGTGFLIGPNKFLTNAHVVSNGQRYLINIYGSPTKHQAKVEYIAHDCDLAILSVENFTPFEKLPVFTIGDAVPQLESQVRVIGYPVGGERLSVTRGVVSRIDFSQYSHSRADSHLIVQIDAAINPGNSGGPVLQDNKVIGVAFQGLTQADNTGYIIPTPVVNRFLKDIEDGKYDEYTDLGITDFPLINPAMRKALKLQNDDKGVLVVNVTPGSASDGLVKPGDVMMSVDDHAIDSTGAILIDGETVNMNEIVERKFAGEKVDLRLRRNEEWADVSITLKALPQSRMYAIKYEEKPRYIVFGGLVFQPLDTNLFATQQFNDVSVRRLYADYVSKGLFQELEDVVILTNILKDKLTSQLPPYPGMAVEKINGTAVKSLKQADELLHPEKAPEYFVIELLGGDRPLVLPAAAIEAADKRIQSGYNIPKLSNLKAR
ncbi:MAG: trypsin-like peptidase domain-containing protein [Verrucomicrobia bacterium]|nr:trypsin-like peptidase domain-containing protein [Verrucomicrobiota bacterium]